MGIFSLAGCALTPGSGPSDESIRAEAKVYARHEGPTLGYDYVLVDVSKSILSTISVDSHDGQFQTFGAANNSKPSLRLGVGDVVQLTVFESQAGGLFIPEDAGARPGNFVELPQQRIDQNGNITVPYAGTIRAAGNTPASVEGTVERRLAERAINPEVSIEVVEQNFSRVTVTGDVAEAGVFALRDSGDRVLEMIAQAGGITEPEYATFVTLTRGGSSVKVAYDAITSNPKENIFLAPGDILDISSEEKTYFAFGAAGSVGQFDFGSEELTLNEAVANLAGLSEAAADPQQVLIYRKEYLPTLQKLGIDTEHLHSYYGKEIPTIYRADYRKPDIFFLATYLQLRDGDIIYVSNADIIEFNKLFGALTNITGAPLGVRNNVQAY